MKRDNQDDFDPRNSIYTPSQVATYGLNAIRLANKYSATGAGVEVPIAGMTDYFPPVMPGQICGIIAQTSNYKSGFLHFIEKHKAIKLSSEEEEEKSILIHVSVEESVEEQAFLFLSQESGEDAGDLSRGVVWNWDKLERASLKIGNIPIFRIGDSLARSEDMPMLYISNMIKAIDVLVNGDVLDYKPVLRGIFFDYLQAFPIDPEFRTVARDQQRRLQVRSDIYRLRQCAARYMCPIFVAIQAKQHLDGARAPIMLPGVYDGEETSSIAQRFDRIITLWMPKTTHSVGETIEYRGEAFTVRENQLWTKVAKQRGRLPAGRVWPCVINFEKNIIAPEQEDFQYG